MKKSIICKGCWIQMHMPVAIRGPLSIPFRLFGVKPSRMNPNLCTICEETPRFLEFFVKGKKNKPVGATVLFADIRGYTDLSQVLDHPALTNLLSNFYEHCSSVIWEGDGIISKLIGDAVLAIFNFPITRTDHVKQAVLSGIELQKKCKEMKARLKEQTEEEISIGVGVGIHTGDVFIGDIGKACRDFTVIGDVVNLAARLQEVANPCEVLLSENVYRFVKDDFPVAESRVCTLKGIKDPVTVYALEG
jgi:adenylate cyclase